VTGENKIILLDVLIGILSFAFAMTTMSYFDEYLGASFFGFIVLVVGLLRGKPKGKYGLLSKTLILISPYLLILLGGILNGVLHLVLVVITTFLGSALGVYARVYFSKNKILFSIALLMFVTLNIYIGLYLIPLIIYRQTTN